MQQKGGEDRRARQDLIAWLECILARELSLPADLVKSVRRFDELGMDSILAVYIAGQLEERFETPIDAQLFYEFPDIDAVVDAVLSKAGQR